MKKKTATKRRVDVGPEYRAGELHFSRHDLARFELAQERVLTSHQAIQLKKAEADRVAREHLERMKALAAEVAALNEQRKRREEALTQLRGELSKLYELDLKTITYDDETGRIRVLPTT